MYSQRLFQYESFMQFFSYYYFLSKHSRGLFLLNSLVRVTSKTLKTQGVCPWIVTQYPPLSLWKAYHLLAVEVMQTAKKKKNSRSETAHIRQWLTESCGHNLNLFRKHVVMVCIWSAQGVALLEDLTLLE